jgi:hypothetical protein
MESGDGDGSRGGAQGTAVETRFIASLRYGRDSSRLCAMHVIQRVSALGTRFIASLRYGRD